MSTESKPPAEPSPSELAWQTLVYVRDRLAPAYEDAIDGLRSRALLRHEIRELQATQQTLLARPVEITVGVTGDGDIVRGLDALEKRHPALLQSRLKDTTLGLIAEALGESERRARSADGAVALVEYRKWLSLLKGGIAAGLFLPSTVWGTHLGSRRTVVKQVLGTAGMDDGYPPKHPRKDATEAVVQLLRGKRAKMLPDSWPDDPFVAELGLDSWSFPRVTRVEPDLADEVWSEIDNAVWFGADPQVQRLLAHCEALGDDAWTSALEQAARAFAEIVDVCCKYVGQDRCTCSPSSGSATYVANESGSLPSSADRFAEAAWLFDGLPRLFEDLAQHERLRSNLDPPATLGFDTAPTSPTSDALRSLIGHDDTSLPRLAQALSVALVSIDENVPERLKQSLLTSVEHWGSSNVKMVFDAADLA